MSKASWSHRLVGLLLVAVQSAAVLAQPRTSSDVQEIKTYIENIPIGGPLTVSMADGTEYHGHLHSIELDSFSIREVDLKTVIEIRYDKVRRVSKEYGNKGIGGRRVNPHRNRIIGLIVLAALLVLVIAAVASDKS